MLLFVGGDVRAVITEEGVEVDIPVPFLMVLMCDPVTEWCLKLVVGFNVTQGLAPE